MYINQLADRNIPLMRCCRFLIRLFIAGIFRFLICRVAAAVSRLPTLFCTAALLWLPIRLRITALFQLLICLCITALFRSLTRPRTVALFRLLACLLAAAVFQPLRRSRHRLFRLLLRQSSSCLFFLLPIVNSRRRLLFCFLRSYMIAKNIQIKRTAQYLCDHPHILFLKIIPSKPLCQILPGHLLFRTYLNLSCQVFDRHVLTAQNDLDLFAKC